MDGRTTKKLITHLKPNTFYNFVLTNRGSSLGGLQQTVTAWTAFNLLSGKPSVAPKPNTDGFIMVYLPDGQSPVPVQYVDTPGPLAPVSQAPELSEPPFLGQGQGEAWWGGGYKWGFLQPRVCGPREGPVLLTGRVPECVCVCSHVS